MTQYRIYCLGLNPAHIARILLGRKLAGFSAGTLWITEHGKVTMRMLA
jgi:hypothetical protein